MFLKILLLLLFPLLASGGPKPFRCNSPEEVREMRIKQVIPTANYTYLLTENQLIFFNPPFCFLNAKNQVICAIDAGEAFEVENSKFKSRTGKQKGFYNLRPQVLAVYENLDDNKLEGQRIHIDEETMDLSDSETSILDKKVAPLFSGQRFTIYYDWVDARSATKTDIISYEQNTPNLLNLNLTVNGDKSISFQKQVDFTLSNLMASHRYTSGNQTLIVFESSKLYTSFFEQGPDEIRMHTRVIEYAELFNCIRRMEKPSDLKGMYFSSDTSSYFIFIHRFFLEIKGDLPTTLTDEHYRGARKLKLFKPNKMPPKLEEKLFYLNLDLKKFIRNYKANAYFLALDSIFKLELEDGNLVGILDKGPDHLLECEHSTLSHEGELYCFAPEQLFICSSDAKPIDYMNLFNGTGVEFDAGDRVEVAFRHLESITIMTKTHYYTFPKQNLELKGSQITLRSSSEKPIIKDAHHLFEKPSPIPSPDATGSTLLLWLIIPLLGILLVIAYLKADSILSIVQKQTPSNKPSRTSSANIPSRTNSANIPNRTNSANIPKTQMSKS